MGGGVPLTFETRERGDRGGERRGARRENMRRAKKRVSLSFHDRSPPCPHARAFATHAIARGPLVTLDPRPIAIASSLPASLLWRGEIPHAFGRTLETSRRPAMRSLASSKRVPRVPSVPREQGEREERAEHGDAASRIPVTSPPPRHRAEKPKAHGIAHHGAQPSVRSLFVFSFRFLLSVGTPALRVP